MGLEIVIIILGFIGLIWGSDKLVFGASIIARNFGVSPLMIGLTIIAFGTSAPEIFTSIAAVLRGEPELATGNAVGSNLINIAIVLGISTLISPIIPPKSLLNKELPALLLVTVVTGFLLADLYLGVLDGFVLLAITAYFGYRLFKNKTKSNEAPILDEENLSQVGSFKAIAYLLLGLCLLILSAQALVDAATNIAQTMGVSTAIIGLTIVAFGTSLPELATSITSALKGHHDLLIGNIVGSNILNLLMVLPFPAILSPGPVERSLLTRDYGTMLLLTLLLALVCFRAMRSGKPIGRLSGFLFLSIYAGWFFVMYSQI